MQVMKVGPGHYIMERILTETGYKPALPSSHQHPGEKSCYSKSIKLRSQFLNWSGHMPMIQ